MSEYSLEPKPSENTEPAIEERKTEEKEEVEELAENEVSFKKLKLVWSRINNF